ncbi:MAG TPA: hypothetical protein VE242_01975 [Chthoniobacterales bacterium]|nr:hypothetical protein [Chthoniobacterales bacterium]
MLVYLFLILLLKAEAEHVRTMNLSSAGQPTVVRSPAVLPEPTPRAGQMSFFSVYCGPSVDQSENQIVVRCKVRRAINNLDEKVAIVGSVYEDVLSTAGRVLIPAGSKVTGQGFCDPERGRILGRGHWTFYVSEHQISIEGTLLDQTRKEGLPGVESETGQDNTKIKKAIYRDGLYLYIPVGTEFALKLTGNSSVDDLGSAFAE